MFAERISLKDVTRNVIPNQNLNTIITIQVIKTNSKKVI